MNVEELNQLTTDDLKATLLKCCGSQNWVDKMVERHPFKSDDQVVNMAERFWHQTSEEDWLEAFSHHPKLGNLEELKEKYTNTSSEVEQEDAKAAPPEVLEELAHLNESYEQKFGFIYILFATGKTAKVILSILRIRLNNDKETELLMAMVEQNKITKLRLEKLLS